MLNLRVPFLIHLLKIISGFFLKNYSISDNIISMEKKKKNLYTR